MPRKLLRTPVSAHSVVYSIKALTVRDVIPKQSPRPPGFLTVQSEVLPSN